MVKLRKKKMLTAFVSICCVVFIDCFLSSCRFGNSVEFKTGTSTTVVINSSTYKLNTVNIFFYLIQLSKQFTYVHIPCSPNVFGQLTFLVSVAIKHVTLGIVIVCMCVIVCVCLVATNNVFGTLTTTKQSFHVQGSTWLS